MGGIIPPFFVDLNFDAPNLPIDRFDESGKTYCWFRPIRMNDVYLRGSRKLCVLVEKYEFVARAMM